LQEMRKLPGRRILRGTSMRRLDQKKPSSRKVVIITTVVFITVVAIGIVVSLYFLVWRDLWRPIITVNGESVNMDYFVRRAKYVNKTDDVLTVLYEIIPNEMLVRQSVPGYGIEVTADEVDELLWETARGENETFSENEFKTWYRDILNVTQLSDAEFRELVYTKMLAERLNEYLVMNIPTVAEQVHLYLIVLPSYNEAKAAIARIEAGEDFSKLARELSIDEETAEQGGDTGWWPEGGGLEASLERVVFNSLEVGRVSDIPVLIDGETGTYAVCLIVEKQVAREIEEDKIEVMKNGALEKWLYIERQNSMISYGGMDWSEYEQRYVFGSTTMAWINLQLARE
jgi:foldase protein PrsA